MLENTIFSFVCKIKNKSIEEGGVFCLGLNEKKMNAVLESRASYSNEIIMVA